MFDPKRNLVLMSMRELLCIGSQCVIPHIMVIPIIKTQNKGSFPIHPMDHPSNGSSMHKGSWHPELRPHHGPGRTSGLFGQAGNPGNGHRQSERRFPFQEPAGLRSLPSSFSGPKKFRLVGPWSHQRPSTWPLMV